MGRFIFEGDGKSERCDAGWLEGLLKGQRKEMMVC